MQYLLLAYLLSLCLLNTEPPFFWANLFVFALSSLPVIVWVTLGSSRLNKKIFSLIFLIALGVFYHVLNFLLKLNAISMSNVAGGKEFITPFLFAAVLIGYLGLRKLGEERSTETTLSALTNSLIAVLLIDFTLRFFSFYPVCQLHCDRFNMKMGGLFPNSNVAGQISSILFVYNFIFARGKNWPRITFLFSLTILTFSRAAIIVNLFAVAYCISTFSIRSKLTRICLLVLSSASLLIVLYALNDDYSLSSKFIFYEKFWHILDSPTNDLWVYYFGGGLSFLSMTKYFDLGGFSGHSPFIKEFLYYGLVGLLWYLSIFIFIIFTIPRTLLFIVLLSGHFITGLPIVSAPMWIFIFALSLSRFDQGNDNSKSTKAKRKSAVNSMQKIFQKYSRSAHNHE